LQPERTGERPTATTVVLRHNALVIVLRATVLKDETSVTRTANDAARVLEFHRQFLAGGAGPRQRETGRIIGAKVGEATAETESARERW